MSMAAFSAYVPAPAAPVAIPDAVSSPTAAAAPVMTGRGEAITAPLPGKILRVNIHTGDRVKSGDILIILEAMKMENEIMASKDGVVTQVFVAKGSDVDTGAVLLTLG